MHYLIGFLVGVGVSFVATWRTIKFAYRFGLVDNPKTHQHPAIVHKGIIPRAGGIPIFLGLLISYLTLTGFFTKQEIGIVVGGAILVLIGILDDKFDLSPYLRFVVNLLVAGIVVLFGIHLNFITNPFGGVLLLNQLVIHFSLFGGVHSIFIVADVLTILWIVWMMNAINWSSGVDGQLAGIIVIGAIVLGLVGYRSLSQDYSQIPVIFLAIATTAAYLGFLPWSFYPQKIMPGYSGSALGGYLLAILSILSGAKLATIFIVLGVPMADGAYAIIRRLSRGQSPFRGDREHFHHHLLAMGVPKRRIALFYWLTCTVLGMIALKLNSSGKLFAGILIVAVFGGVTLWIHYSSTFSKQPGQDNG